MRDARFRVRHSSENVNWIKCIPLNSEAKELIHGMKEGLWPAYPAKQTESFFEWAQKYTTHHKEKLSPTYYQEWLDKNDLKDNSL